MINMCPKTGRTCEVTGCNGCWKDEKQMTNQYALGYKAGLDAAVKLVSKHTIGHTDLLEAIAALPVPEVQWREITDDDVLEVMRDISPATHPQLFARAVIAKFKEKQL